MVVGREKFGAFIRRQREAKERGLREMAKMIGVSPTYLSKVERDEFPPPAEDKVKAIAKIIECDPDELLARAGRVSTDISDIIKRHPVELAALLRTTKGLPAEDIASRQAVCPEMEIRQRSACYKGNGTRQTSCRKKLHIQADPCPILRASPPVPTNCTMTSFVSASICVRGTSIAVTQTDPSPTAMSPPCPGTPTSTVATTRFVVGSMRETVPSP
jgi:transcriptional regulator with XRE-family HTH domain